MIAVLSPWCELGSVITFLKQETEKRNPDATSKPLFFVCEIVSRLHEARVSTSSTHLPCSLAKPGKAWRTYTPSTSYTAIYVGCVSPFKRYLGGCPWLTKEQRARFDRRTFLSMMMGVKPRSPILAWSSTRMPLCRVWPYLQIDMAAGDGLLPNCTIRRSLAWIPTSARCKRTYMRSGCSCWR
jgi:hypothetical protein